jgi:transposase
MSMTGSITSAQRRRRWSAEEKARIVQDVGVVGGAPGRDRAEPGVHLPAAVCRGRAVGGRNRRTVVPFSEYRTLQYQVRERQRLLGKKTLENEVLRDALELAQPKNGCCVRPRRHRTTRSEDDRRYPRRLPAPIWLCKRPRSAADRVAGGVRNPRRNVSPRSRC